jgi:hypothetical protein
VKIHDQIEQNSLEWYMLRAGKVTASEADRLITPLGKIKTGDGPKSYLMEKLAERWLQAPLPAAQGVWDLDQGHLLEDYAKPAFTLETGLPVRNAAFITGSNENVGCSPDGLLMGDTCGLELKSPHLEKHIRYLLDGVVPPDYVAQVQTSMYVTGFSHWYFCSFRRGLPLLILNVPRDDKFQSALEEAVQGFLADLDTAWLTLCERNGGPPPKRKVFIPSPESEDNPYVEVGITP